MCVHARAYSRSSWATVRSNSGTAGLEGTVGWTALPNRHHLLTNIFMVSHTWSFVCSRGEGLGIEQPSPSKQNTHLPFCVPSLTFFVLKPTNTKIAQAVTVNFTQLSCAQRLWMNQGVWLSAWEWNWSAHYVSSLPFEKRQYIYINIPFALEFDSLQCTCATETKR